MENVCQIWWSGTEHKHKLYPISLFGDKWILLGGGGVYQFITHPLLSIVSILFFLYQIKAVKIFSGILLHNWSWRALTQAPSLTESTAKNKDLKLYLFLSALSYTMYQIINLLVVWLLQNMT